MTGIETAILGATLSSAVGGGAASAVGLLGAGGVFAPLSGTLLAGTSAFGGLSTLSTIASVGSSFFGAQASSAEAAASQSATATNLAYEKSRTAKDIAAEYRQQGLREGSARAAAAAQGRTASGNVLDILEMNTAQSELDILGARESLSYTAGLAKSKIASSKSSNKTNQYAGILSGVSKLIDR